MGVADLRWGGEGSRGGGVGSGGRGGGDHYREGRGTGFIGPASLLGEPGTEPQVLGERSLSFILFIHLHTHYIHIIYAQFTH